MNSLKTVQNLPESRRQAIISLDLTREQGVASQRGLFEYEEKGRRRRLLLICDVGVPGNSRNSVIREVFFESIVLSITENDMEFWEVFDVSRSRMTLDWAVTSGDGDLSLRAEVLEVLVTEDQELAFRGEERKLVQSCLIELTDLDPPDFRANVRVQLGKGCTSE